MTSKDIILMDGDCGLCTHTAVFLTPRLKQQYSISFIAIETKEGQELISTFSEKLQRADSVYLIRDGKSYMRSAAGIRCLLYMKWYYSMWYPFFWLIPLPLRDLAYRIVARYRHRVFKRPATCIFPSLNPE
jgi:predicted DCC family thiol-disulfide oxidoreductase YuxK